MMVSLRLRHFVAGVGLASLICAAEAKRPNILFIITDDQDLHMQSVQHMPLLQKYIINEGTFYAQHHCTTALCCPSRVNLWTGKVPHNTNVTDVKEPYGGYPKIVHQGINDDYLPVWLQDEGYNTYYVGKLWNQHTIFNYNAPYARGFNGSEFLLDPTTYDYYNASLTRNGGPPTSYEGHYSPDVTAEKAYGFLYEAISHAEPWFVVHAPIAPHGEFTFRDGQLKVDLPKYADRHAHLFNEYIIPRTDSFNPEDQGGVGWVKGLPRLNDTAIERNDEFQRARLRSLQAVDEMVENMIHILESAGQLDDTYIFFTTDNGYHISQHRMYPGKECGFDTDVHIPLAVRGPGVPIGHVSNAVTSHTDLASTIMQIAGSTLADTDGSPIPLTSEDEKQAKSEHVTIEFWGKAFPESPGSWYGEDGDGHAPNNTYKAIRVISEAYSLYYAVWCTNESELYDLKTDPGEVHNLLAGESDRQSDFRVAGRPLKEVVSRLDALTMVLKSCKRESCIQPWHSLHPDGDVSSLVDSLDRRFDTFYDHQPKVEFTRCELGYMPESEGPMSVNSYGGSSFTEQVETLEYNESDQDDEL